MSSRGISQEIADAPVVADATREIAMRSVLDDLSGVSPANGERGGLDWNRLLLLASAVGDDASALAQDAALRIAQGCLQDREATRVQHQAATYLLERMGNHEAVRLAERRQMTVGSVWDQVDLASAMDLIRRSLELSLTLGSGTQVGLNPFQRQFWSAALSNDWVSVSATTSAGKSFIVKRWLEDLASRNESMRFIYLVPTRALIEEVTNDLRLDPALSVVGIHNLPWSTSIGTSPKEVFVMTQERVHLLQTFRPEIVPDVIFVDEAQKFGDDSRGVLLQRVITEAVERKPDTKLIFASPMTSNPGLLLDGAPADATSTVVASESVTVNQNLLWANQVRGKPMEWTLDLLHRGDEVRIGTFRLLDRAQPDGKRLPYVAVALGREQSGNLVYANGANAAETTAKYIADALPGDVHEQDPSVSELIELVESTIHRQYALVEALRHGVAFHYGNMPLLVRAEIERLFREGRIKYLVCTSTLLEGVNLPCRAIFVRGPKKGQGNPMTSYDFWNLAGRAGRWGREFEGNIVCVDTAKQAVWPDPPRVRTSQPVTRASDSVVADHNRLISYIDAGTPVEQSRAWPLGEAVFSFMADRVARGMSIQGVPGLTATDEEQTQRILQAVRTQVSALTLPVAVFGRHPGISPVAMQRLFNYAMSIIDVSQLALRKPSQDGAFDSYESAMAICADYLGADFGNDRRQRQLASLVLNWMRGYQLARIIDERVNYYRSVRESFNIAAEIRNAMSDVEKYARFEIPKYFSCYADIVSYAHGQRGVEEEDRPDIAMMLELGVSRQTDMALMALGLSRTSAIEVGRLFEGDDLTPEGARAILSELPIENLKLPTLVKREIVLVLGRSTGRISRGSID